MCTGNSSKCLQPSQKDNFLCNWNSSVCIKGVCSGKSVCSNFGFEACFCEDQLVDQCKICCLSEDKCLPAQNISKVCVVFFCAMVWLGMACSGSIGVVTGVAWRGVAWWCLIR